MQTYFPPIDDYRFPLTDVLRFDAAMVELGNANVDAALTALFWRKRGDFARNDSILSIVAVTKRAAFARRVLPQVRGLAAGIGAGEAPVMALPAEAF